MLKITIFRDLLDFVEYSTGVEYSMGHEYFFSELKNRYFEHFWPILAIMGSF